MSPEQAAALRLDRVDDAIRAIADGELVIVVDDTDRENEGDLILAASRATADKIAFIIRHTSGIVCTPLPPDLARRLKLSAMVADNDAPLQTAFTVSIDYRVGLTTGISADERTNTIRALANGNAGPDDFVRPGHVFPLVAREGGVLMRSGHTEAAVDLSRLAGLPPVGVLAELVNDDGTVKRLPELVEFAREHQLKMISIADLIAYRQQRERLVKRVAEFDVPTVGGTARGMAYTTPFDAVQHLALVFGDVRGDEPVPVRIHRESIVRDVFASRAEPGRDSISKTLTRFRDEGRGVLLYLREGSAGVPAEALQSEDAAAEAASASEKARDQQWREIGVGAQILRDLGVSRIRLLATRRLHYVGLDGFGIDLVETDLLQE
ncbi:MAG: 3,4-dihydroxy-2-butanone-4-phosphate synthase [Ectothiorhodospiraceae bacterium]|nr:3,4-dihydroxy-2-butanone-4-phosphate synthase [Ectothiorhodospiraceae bacterium]